MKTVIFIAVFLSLGVLAYAIGYEINCHNYGSAATEFCFFLFALLLLSVIEE